MIESPRGVANADAIAAMPGVDVLWVGHFDLTQSMGIPAQFRHPEFLGAVQKVIAATRRHGKVAGINPRSHEQADEWIAAGFNAISWGNNVKRLSRRSLIGSAISAPADGKHNREALTGQLREAQSVPAFGVRLVQLAAKI
jgi:2-keto-3-deoxy-L-rhamnonate aldolase RhmA